MPEEIYDSEEDDDYDPSTEKGVEGEKPESRKKRQRCEDGKGPEELTGSGRGKVSSVGTDPLEQLKANAKKTKINAIWETLNSKNKNSAPSSNGFGASTGQTGASGKFGSMKGATSSVPSWMVSLGLAKPNAARVAANGSPSAGSVDIKKSETVSAVASAEAMPSVRNEPADVATRGEDSSTERQTTTAHGEIEITVQTSEAKVPTYDGTGQDSTSSGIGETQSTVVGRKTDSCKGLEGKGVSESSLSIAAAALAAVKAVHATSSVQTDGKLKVTEVHDFAGQEVEVTTLVDPNSKAAQSIKRKAEYQAKSSSGIDAMLAQIERKKKLNILDKSRKDWGEYKEDKGVIEELETFKKSGTTYTEKVAFLGRADLREYEKERDARLAGNRRRASNSLTED